MRVTEQEAKKKWCPMDRYAEMQTISGIEKIVVTNEGSRCLASKCMCWRWFSVGDRVMENGPQSQGFCGLAGKPV